MIRVIVVLAILISSVNSGLAQQLGRSQDGFYSGQSNGQVDERVDGRANINEGLPPSAADKENRLYQNPLGTNDCGEVDALKPDARPVYQDRLRSDCEE